MYFPIPTSPNIIETPDFSNRPFVAGFELTVTGATTMTFLPGCARSVDKPDTIFYPPINANAPGVITLDVSTVFTPGGLDANGNQIIGTPVGFGGCFPLPLNQAGLAGNNTVFPLYAIGDSTGKAFTTIIVPTSANFLPAGYDSFVRVGQVYINGTTFNIIPFLQTGHYEVRNYVLADAVRVLTAGAATVPTLVDLSTGNGPVTPGPTSKVLLLVEFQSATQTDSLMLIPTGLTSASVPPVQFENTVISVNSLSNVEMAPGIDVTTGDSGIDYFATSASDTSSIWVSGWSDDMGVALR